MDRAVLVAVETTISPLGHIGGHVRGLYRLGKLVSEVFVLLDTATKLPGRVQQESTLVVLGQVRSVAEQHDN